MKLIKKSKNLFLCTAVFIALIWVISGKLDAVSLFLPSDGYGFGQGAAPIYLSFEDTNRELDAVAQTSATWLRVLIDWSNIEKQRGQFNWSWLDNLINNAQARHLKILGVIGYTPQWARPSGSEMLWWTSPPAQSSEFAVFCTKVVERYGERIFNWEIWNEPNLPLFFGFTDNKAKKYTEVLQAAYLAIKAAQPWSTILVAGLSRLNGIDSPPGFLQQMYEAGAAGYFDAAAAHPYVFPGGLAADPTNGWSDVGRMHDVMAAHGDGNKKIWLTEMGAPTCDCLSYKMSQEEQASQILEVMAAAAQTFYIGPAFIYSIRDLDTTKRRSREKNLGALLTFDWQTKFTASVLAR